jgi:hypothetical protein
VDGAQALVRRCDGMLDIGRRPRPRARRQNRPCRTVRPRLAEVGRRVVMVGPLLHGPGRRVYAEPFVLRLERPPA